MTQSLWQRKFIATGLVITPCSFSVSWNIYIQSTREGKCQILCKFKLTFHIPNPIVFTQLILYLICISFQNQESLFKKRTWNWNIPWLSQLLQNKNNNTSILWDNTETTSTYVMLLASFFPVSQACSASTNRPSSPHALHLPLAVLPQSHPYRWLPCYHTSSVFVLIPSSLPQPSETHFSVDGKWSLVSWNWCSLNSCVVMVVYALNGR